MRTTIYALAAVAGTVLAKDDAGNFMRDTAPSSSAANVVSQISDGMRRVSLSPFCKDLTNISQARSRHPSQQL